MNTALLVLKMVVRLVWLSKIDEVEVIGTEMMIKK